MNHRLLLSALLVLPFSAAHAAPPSDLLDKAPSRFAKSGDIKIYYKILNAQQAETKPALVFIHGWCCDLTVWRDQSAACDGKAPMIFIDLPGYGKSDRPDVDYTMDFFAKSINAVLEDAKTNKAILIGHNTGTPIVREFYRLYPAKTAALVFVDGSLRSPVTDRDQGLKDIDQAEQFLSRIKDKNFQNEFESSLSAMVTEGAPADVKERLRAILQNTDVKVAISTLRGMFDFDWPEDQVKVPTQALIAKSSIWTEEHKQFLKKLVPDLDCREFENVGHFLFMEKPEQFNTALHEFLKKQKVIN